MHTARYITLAVATVDTLTSAASYTPVALTHLIGVAMLIVERGQGGRWSFDLDAMTADKGEAELLDWLTERLPAATVIGWQVGDRLLPALLDAVANAEAPLAHRFASACAQTFTAPCIDLALDHGGVAAPPFEEVARSAGFRIETIDERQDFNAWAFTSLDGVKRQLEREATTLWRLWLKRSCSHADAIDPTARWADARSF